MKRAFPLGYHALGRDHDDDGTGMSLRDWFAGQALAMTAPAYVNLPESAEILARRCYAVADAMLAERERAGGARG